MVRRRASVRSSVSCAPPGSIRKRPPPPCWLRRAPLGLGFSPGPQGSSRSQQVCVAFTQRQPPPRRSLTAGTCHHSQPALVLRAARPRAAPTGTFKERISPSAHPARLAYPRRKMPPPGYHRRTQGLSPSRRLDGHPCVPGLFHPGRAHGVLPSRAFSLRGAVTPLDARCLPDLRQRAFRAQPITAPHADERCADRSPGPRDPGGQAPGGADPAAARRASETRCNPTTRCRVDPAVLPWRRKRRPDAGSRGAGHRKGDVAGLQGLAPREEHGPPGAAV